MKIAYPLLNGPIVFSENHVNVLIIENAPELRRVISDIQIQTEGGTGDIILSENDSVLEMSKNVMLVTDPFTLEFDSKKISGKLTQEAVRASASFEEDLRNIISSINLFASKISTVIDMETAFTEIEDADGVIKLLNFCIDKENLTLPEQLLEFMKLHRSFFNRKLFVFYNIKACLSDEELKLFYKNVQYEKLNVLLIEDFQRRRVSEEEKMTIVDNDLCIL